MLDSGECFFIRPQVQRPAAGVVETPHVVQAHDVVGVGVRKYHRVDAIHIIGDALKPQFRRRIHQHAHLPVGDHHRRTRAPVVRIGRSADVALAPDHRHPGTGAGAQEQQLYFGHPQGL